MVSSVLLSCFTLLFFLLKYPCLLSQLFLNSYSKIPFHLVNVSCEKQCLSLVNGREVVFFSWVSLNWLFLLRLFQHFCSTCFPSFIGSVLQKHLRLLVTGRADRPSFLWYSSAAVVRCWLLLWITDSTCFNSFWSEFLKKCFCEAVLFPAIVPPYIDIRIGMPFRFIYVQRSSAAMLSLSPDEGST